MPRRVRRRHHKRRARSSDPASPNDAMPEVHAVANDGTASTLAQQNISTKGSLHQSQSDAQNQISNHSAGNPDERMANPNRSHLGFPANNHTSSMVYQTEVAKATDGSAPAVQHQAIRQSTNRLYDVQTGAPGQMVNARMDRLVTKMDSMTQDLIRIKERLQNMVAAKNARVENLTQALPIS